MSPSQGLSFESCLRTLYCVNGDGFLRRLAVPGKKSRPVDVGPLLSRQLLTDSLVHTLSPEHPWLSFGPTLGPRGGESSTARAVVVVVVDAMARGIMMIGMTSEGQPGFDPHSSAGLRRLAEATGLRQAGGNAPSQHRHAGNH